MENYMKLEIAAIGENEGFARSAVAAFALALNPTLTDLSDVKTAVSEAVTNSIVHAYAGEKKGGKILIECTAQKEENGEGKLHIQITDYGCGIEDVEKAVMPFYTTLAGEERSGMGFTIMQTFMDDCKVESERGKGTRIEMYKTIGGMENVENGEVRKRVDA